MELARIVPDRLKEILLIAPAGLVPMTVAETTQIHGLRLARFLGIPVASWLGKLAGIHTATAEIFEPDGASSERGQEAATKSAQMYNSNPEKFAKSWLKSVRDMGLGGNYGAYAGLAASGVPTMFLWGDSDETIPFCAIRDEVRRFFPTSPMKIIQNTGHDLLVDHSDTITTVAAQWFARKSPPQADIRAMGHMSPRSWSKAAHCSLRRCGEDMAHKKVPCRQIQPEHCRVGGGPSIGLSSRQSYGQRS
eukprot:TRINITY_DN77402_c0_g1_i1.p1 TRINITY_DN77402_c0_g1~~TRINITY_DN77402_c0_g1_i1.p1  ORF type:complete len:249 (-),score=22.22 TRINITY_DN77402_c0_g1_i1:46-792(-)